MTPHRSQTELRHFAVDPRGIGEPAGTAIELHLIECAACRTTVAAATPVAESARDWDAIERALAEDTQGWAEDERGGDFVEAPFLRVDGRSGGRSSARGTPWRRSLAVAAGLLLVAVVVATLTRSDDGSGVAAGAGDAWRMVEVLDDEDVPWGTDSFFPDLLDWQDRVLVLETEADTGRIVARHSADGVGWESTELVPSRDSSPGEDSFTCDVWGAASTGREILLPCKIVGDDDMATIALWTSSPDLTSGSLAPISEPGWFFDASVAVAPDGTVVVRATRTDDPNTWQGSLQHVWTSEDLRSWDPITSPTETMRDAGVERLRAFDDRIVLVGSSRSPFEDGTPNSEVAIWQSVERRPFERIMLPGAGAETVSGVAQDVVPSGDQLLVVGVVVDADDLVPASWVGTAEDGFARTAIDPRPVPSMLSVVDAGGVMLVVGEDGGDPHAWRSVDGGRRWQPVDPGPTTLGLVTGQPVGISTVPPALWRWGPPG